MTHKLIHTPDYLLVVDDSEIKEDCIAIHLGPLGEQEIVTANGECKLDKKIIAHLPLNESPILEGADLLPPLEQEDDVEALAKTQWGNVHRTGVLGYIEGYNKAKEKYKYTEEDINIMVNNTLVFAMSNTHLSVGEYATQFKDFYDKCIQSLSQPKMPVGFECEWTPMNPYEYTDEEHLKVKPKTTTNSQGQTVWVGKYIY